VGYSFDGTNKIISLTSGTTTLDVQDLYSRWKDWLTQADNAKYLQAMSTVGGDPISETVAITGYYFLQNGWKIRPQEASHKLQVTNGVLACADGSDPFIQTLGAYNVMVQYSQPIRTETAVIETGVSGLTNEESVQLLAIPTTSPLAELVEDDKTLTEVLRIMLAVLAGKVSGAPGDTLRFRNQADSKDRVVATVDTNGNRLVMDLDGA
jgi:hypothetical protein